MYAVLVFLISPRHLSNNIRSDGVDGAQETERS